MVLYKCEFETGWAASEENLEAHINICRHHLDIYVSLCATYAAPLEARCKQCCLPLHVSAILPVRHGVCIRGESYRGVTYT